MYRWLGQARKSLFIIIYTLKYLGFFAWLKYWLSPGDQILQIGGKKILTRGDRLLDRIVDTYMAVSCIDWRQYEGDRNVTGIVIDIGSHIGSFAIHAAETAEKVYSFEPEYNNYTQLIKNVRINGLSNISAASRAVAVKSGRVSFYKDTRNTAAHSTTVKLGEATEVDCSSLDDIFTVNNIAICDFMKLDCEGAEYEILMNASQDALSKIKRISMEYHNEYDLNTLLKRLEESGFVIRKNEPENSYQGIIWAER